MNNKYTIGFKKHSGSLIELEFDTIEEAFKEGFSQIMPDYFLKTEVIGEFIHIYFYLHDEDNEDENDIYIPYKVEYINNLLTLLVCNQEANDEDEFADTFKFMIVKEQEEDEFILTFDFYDEDEDRFDTADYREKGLLNVFAYAMECLFPECSFEFTLEGNTLKYTYQGETEDDNGEDEIEYTVEAMNEYIKDFIENNETNLSNMVIGNWTQFHLEQEKSRITVLSEDSDIPF